MHALHADWIMIFSLAAAATMGLEENYVNYDKSSYLKLSTAIISANSN